MLFAVAAALAGLNPERHRVRGGVITGCWAARIAGGGENLRIANDAIACEMLT